jgi:hypothetical protein
MERYAASEPRDCASGSRASAFVARALGEHVPDRGEGFGFDAEEGQAAALLALDPAGLEEHLKVVADRRLS